MAMANSFGLAPLLLTLTCLFCCYSTISSSSQAISEGFLGCIQEAEILVYEQNDASFTRQLEDYTRNPRFLGNATGRPLYIVMPANAVHVQAAVRCSTGNDMPIRVRSGGHDYEGLSYRSVDAEAFAMLDMSQLRSVAVDKNTSTAWVESGATLGELYYAIGKASKTLAFPAGVCPTVGVGGQFTGGGFGMLMRKYGLSIDNIIDAEMVDAKGRILRKDDMGSDVFWAIRGGSGGSFGVVVKWQVSLVTVPATVAVLKASVTQAPALVVHKWQLVAPYLPDELYIRVLLENKTANFRSLYLGSCHELLLLMRRSFPDLLRHGPTCEEMTWVESVPYIYLGSSNVEDLLVRTTSDRSNGFKATTDYVRKPLPWDILFDIFSKLNGPSKGQVVLVPYGGQMGRVPVKATPFPHRAGVLYHMQVYNYWPMDMGDEAAAVETKWVRDMYAFMAPYVVSQSKPRGAYSNCRDLDLGPDWGRKYFGATNYERLTMVKAQIDPDNYFHDEQSIRLPTTSKYLHRLQRPRPLSSSTI